MAGAQVMHLRPGGGDNRDDGTPQPTDVRWWLHEDDDTAAKAMVATVEVMDTIMSTQLSLDDKNLRLYGSQQHLGIGTGKYWQTTALETNRDERLRLNICRSCVDTVTAKVGKIRPRPMFLTSGGTWEEQRRAKKLNHFMDGMFFETKVHEQAPSYFRDAAVFGSGIAKVHSEPGSVVVERTFPSELYVDRMDGLYGRPRTIYQIRFVDREVLAATFPAAAVKIMMSDARDDDTGFGRDPQAKQVRVIEGWHLPSRPGGKDGRHIIAVRAGIIGPTTAGGKKFNTEWKRNRFPFAFMRWSKPLLGFWGRGLVQEITPIQIEINYCLMKLQKILTLHAQPMVFVRRQGKIALARVGTNALGTMHEVNDPSDIQVYTPPPMGQELLNWIDSLLNRAYQNAGISQLSAQALKPAGLTAGVALQTYDDIETERFSIAARDFEEFHIDIAELCLDEVREMDDNDFEVRSVDRSTMRAIRWGDVAIKENAYVLQCFPTSMLPQRPEGKLQRVTDMVNSGLIDQRAGMKLLDFPDLEAYTSRAFSSEEAVDAQIEKMLEEGEQLLPEPTYNLDYAFKRAVQEVNLGTMNDMPEETAELLRTYAASAKDQLDRAQAAIAQSMAAAQGGQMPAPGGPADQPGQMAPPPAVGQA